MPRFGLTLLVPLLGLAALACSADPAAPGGADAGAPDGAAREAAGACAPIVQLAYAGDGQWLAAARADGQAALVHLATAAGRRLALPVGTRIALSNDGALLATAADGAVDLWSVADGTRVRSFPVVPGVCRSLKFSVEPPFLLLAAIEPGAAGNEAAGQTADNVRIWRVADGILVGSLAGSALATFTLADAGVLLLDERGGRFDVLTFGGRPLRGGPLPAPLGRTAFAADGAYFGGVTGAGSADEHLAIMAVGEQTFTWRSSQGSRATRQIVFLENPSRLLQLGETALLYDHQDGSVLRPLPSLDGALTAAAAPDGSAIAAALGDGSVVLVAPGDGSSRRVPGLGDCDRGGE